MHLLVQPEEKHDYNFELLNILNSQKLLIDNP